MESETEGNSTVPGDPGPGETTNVVSPAQVEIDLTSPPRTFGALLKVALPVVLQSRKYMFLKFVFYTVVAVFIGTSYYDIGTDETKVWTNVVCIFYTILLTIFMGMMPTILKFPQQMADFERENPEDNATIAFYTTKTLIDMPFLILVCSIYSVTIYVLTSQPPEFVRAMMFVIIYAMTTLISYSIALFIAIEFGLKSRTQRAFAAVVTVVLFVLLAGYWIHFSSIPKTLQWLKLLSYVRYAFEGSLISVYGFGRDDFLQCLNTTCHFQHPNVVLKDLEMDEMNITLDSAGLVIIFMVLQTFIIFSLQWRLKPSRNQ